MTDYEIDKSVESSSLPTLRDLILEQIGKQGFELDHSGTIALNTRSKKHVRALHECYRSELLRLQSSFLSSNLKKLRRFFADGRDIDLTCFKPVLVPVEKDTLFSSLFRLASLTWSVPVSNGFGRRVRFLILDEYNTKLVGLFALGDPVFNLRARDQWIGWNHKQRASRLYNVMDLFVLGAIPPYSNLLCGKLIALIATSSAVRDYVFNRYKGTKTTIRGEYKENPHVALLTTTSALGRSSLYNRVKFGERLVYQRLGETQGWGHFHLGNGTYELMRRFLCEVEDPIVKKNRFGQGPNWKMRLVRTCLSRLGLSEDLLRHGIRREFYAAPLASNFKEYLLGQNEHLNFYDYQFDEIVHFFFNRWMLPRAKRFPSYRQIKAEFTLSDLFKVS